MTKVFKYDAMSFDKTDGRIGREKAGICLFLFLLAFKRGGMMNQTAHASISLARRRNIELIGEKCCL